MSTDDPRHGTNAGYIAGCRNQCCKTAHATYRRNLYARQYIARGPMTIPALGTQRRIRALQAIGWRISDIADALGLANSRGVCQPIWQLLNRDVVRRSTAARIADLYDAWCMTPGPAATRNLAIAKRRGWVTPLGWNDIDNDPEPPSADDLSTRESYDHAIIERFLAGEHSLHTSVPERREIVRRWVARGRSLGELERATGWNAQRYVRREEGVA